MVAALLEGRNFIGIEKNENVALFKNKEVDYIKISKNRILRAYENMRMNYGNKLKNIVAINLLEGNYELQVKLDI